MEIWQLLLSIAGVAGPLILAAMARDRAMMTMISGTRGDWERSIATAKEDCRKIVDTAMNTSHDRINRIRDEYVRRDDFQGHLNRIDKQFDAVHEQIDRVGETIEKKLDEIRKFVAK